MKEKVLGRIYKHKRLYAWMMALIMVASLVVVPGGQVKEVKAEGETDLRNFVNTVTVTDPDTDNVIEANYNVKDKDYKVLIEYSEDENDNTKQFITDSEGNPVEMIYTYPSAITMTEIPSTDPLSISVTVSDGSNSYTLNDNKYYIEDNKMHIKFNTADTEAYTAWKNAGNAYFRIEATGRFKADATTIDWGNGKSYGLTVDSTSHVKVEKNRSYPGSGEPIQYTVKATSSNTNNNVTIEDTFTGDGIEIDYTSMVVKKKDGTVLTAGTDYTLTKSTTGFNVVVGKMSDGEEVTVTYNAVVTSEGATAAEVSADNKVKIHSDEDSYSDNDTTWPKSSQAQKYSDERLSTSKSGVVSSTVEDGKYRITEWTVVVNGNLKTSVNGYEVTDEITALKDITTYDGKVTMTKTDAAGNNKGTETITPGASGWSYTINDSEIYKYTFTYKTKTDATGLVSSGNLTNKVTQKKGDHSQEATGSVSIGPLEGNSAKIAKSVENVDMANLQATWKIVLTIPKGGLDSAVFTDKAPDVWGGSHYVDKIVGEPEIEGLYEGETAAYNKSVDSNNSESFTYTFSKNVGGVAKDGLYQSTDGNERTITIKYKTTIDENWLEDSSVPTHTNHAEFNANGSKVESNASINPVKPTEKTMEKALKLTRTESGIPYAVYEVEFTGFEAGKTYVFTDTYDSKYLSLVNKDEGIWNDTHPELRFGTYNYDYYGGYLEDNNLGSFSVDEAAGKITFTITVNDNLLNNGVPYKWYRLRYALRHKPGIDYDALKTEAAAASGGEYKFVNKISNSEFGESENDDFTYEYSDIKKTLGNPGTFNVAEISRDDAIAEYELVLNEDALEINQGDPYVVVDTPTNLSILFDTITITPSDAGVIFNPQSGTVRYTVPDSKKVTISYKAKVIAAGEFKNEAKIESKGSTSSAGGTVQKFSKGQGGGDIHKITIAKFKDGDYEHSLKGAVFQLFKDDNGEKVPVKNLSGDNVTFTTGDDGKASIQGKTDVDGWTLVINNKYYVKEIVPPTGYSLDNTYYQFTIAEQSDYDNYVYFDDDIMTVKNSSAKIQLEKLVEGAGKPDDADIPFIFNFKLTPVTSGAPMPSTAVGNEVNVRHTGVGVIDFGQILLTDATTAPYIYKITEEAIDSGHEEYSKPATAEIYVKVYAVNKTIKDSEGNDKNVLDPHVEYYQDAACTVAATLNSRGIPNITNTYTKPGDVTAVLQVNKKVKDKNTNNPVDSTVTVPQAFNFELSAVGTAPLPDTTTLTNVGAGIQKFPAITYDSTIESGTSYVYKIAEKPVSTTVAGADQFGLSTVATENTVYAKVTINGTGSARLADVKYYSDEACSTPVTEASIINYYPMKEATGILNVTKAVANMPADKADEKYTVTVRSDSGKDLSEAKVNDGAPQLSTDKKSIILSIKKDETAVITELPIDTYTVTETVDDTLFTAEYSVDEGTGSSSPANVTFTKSSLSHSVKVLNSYIQSNDIEKAIQVKKIVKNVDTGEALTDAAVPDIFTFELSAVTSGAPMPTVTRLTDVGAGLKSFDNITFAKTIASGTSYIYKITETSVKTGNDEYKMPENEADRSVYAKVTVMGTGVMRDVSVEYFTDAACTVPTTTGTPDITNTYEKKTGKLSVKKEALNVPGDKESALYTITVKSEDNYDLSKALVNGSTPVFGNSGADKTSIVINIAKGTVPMQITKLPLGDYTVTEASDDSYVTKYRVGDVVGSESAAVPVINLKDDNTDQSVTVINTYNSDTTATLKIKKEIAAASGSTAPAAADVPKAFNFKLEAVTTGAPMPDAGGETLSNVGAEEKSFGVITYPGTTAENKEYIYKISETEITSTVADAERYSMPTELSVYAKVKITGSGSARTTDVKYYSDEACRTELTGGAVITNTYTGENAVTAQLEITKDVTADSGVTVPRTIPNIFNFKLEAVDTAAPMPDGTGNILKNVGKETKKFGVITYSANGDYRYKISETGKDETNASAAEYLVSTAVVYAKVSVSGIGTSSPAATVKYYSNEACTTEITGTPTITNTYEKNVGKIKLRKTIEGPITENDKKGLTFEVYNSAGELQGKYVLGKDFTETTDSSGNTVYEKELSVAAGEGYYVVETLYEFDGTAVTVTYTVENEGEGIVDSDEALEGADGAETDPFEVKKGKTTTVTLNNVYEADTGYIDLTKTIKGDVTEEDLKGLTFEVLDGANKKWATFKLGEDFVKETDSTGKEIYRLKKKLEIGKGQYKIVEKLYKFDGSTVTVSYTVNEADGTITQGSGAETELSKVTGGKTTTFNYENDYKLDLVIKKVGKYNESCSSDSEATKPLVGVEFAIYDSTAPTVELAKKKTVDGGTVTFSNLDTGTYIIKETATIDDYVLLEDSYTVSVVSGKEPVLKDKDGNEVKDKTIVNDIYRADIKLLKVNESDTSEKLPSSTYGLYRTDASGKEELIAKNTTDSQGTLVFKGVKTGVDYTIKELEAPDGFYVSEQPIKVSFKVNENKEVVFDTAKFNTGNGTATVNEKGEITWLEPIVKASFAKVDKDGNALSGATLHVEDASGKVVESWTSGTSAHAIDGKLNCGQTYKLVEDKAPDGYNVADPISFSIDNEMGPNQEKVVTVTMTDEKKAETTDEEEEEEDEDEEEEEEEETTSTKKKTGSSSKTGDSAPIAGAAGALILSLCGAYVLLRKKER